MFFFFKALFSSFKDLHSQVLDGMLNMFFPSFTFSIFKRANSFSYSLFLLSNDAWTCSNDECSFLSILYFFLNISYNSCNSLKVSNNSSNSKEFCTFSSSLSSKRSSSSPIAISARLLISFSSSSSSDELESLSLQVAFIAFFLNLFFDFFIGQSATL